MKHIALNRDDRAVEVTIDSVERIESNKTVSATVSIDPALLANQSMYAVVTLVDQGILNISEYAAADAHASLFASWRFQTQLPDNYADVIHSQPGKLYQQSYGGGFKKTADSLNRGAKDTNAQVELVSFTSDLLHLMRKGKHR